MLAIKALNQFYGSSHTLWDVDLVVSPGSRMCLMGRNGMGKTTLLKCIMGLQAASSGGIDFDGTDLLKLPAEQRAKLGIGYVPQGREIFSRRPWRKICGIGIGVRKNGVLEGSQPDLRVVSRAEADVEPAGEAIFQAGNGSSSRRSAYPGAGTETADPGRTDRRDSAQYRPRNRRHRLEAEPGRRGLPCC